MKKNIRQQRLNAMATPRRIAAIVRRGTENMNRITTVFICVLVFAFHVFSENENCYSSSMGKTIVNLPESISIDSIYKVTGLGPWVCGLAMKKWPYSDSIYVVYSEDSAVFTLHMLKQKGHTFKVIASYNGKMGEYQFSEFDFAPYKIRKNNTAIGIRFVAKGPTIGGGWECKKLELYEYSESRLRLIMSTLMNYAAEGNNVAYDFDTHYSFDESAILIIGKSDANGFNSFIKKVNTKKYTYRYTDGIYTTLDEPDCIGDSVSNCFCPSESIE